MTAFYRMLSLIAALLVWQAVSLLIGRDVIPTPFETANAFRELVENGELGAAVIESLQVYLVGFVLAALFGIALGVTMGGIPLVGRVLDPYAYALTATPRVAFIPLIIVLLGLGFEAKTTIVFLGAAMPILLNTYVGVAQAEPELVEMARSAGAGRLQQFTGILLPSALPDIVGGLRLGASIGLINTVVAELYTAVQGLGGLLAIYGNTFQMAHYFAVILVLATLGICVSQLLRTAERRVARWRCLENE